MKSTLKFVIASILISQNNVKGYNLIRALFKIIVIKAFDVTKVQSDEKSEYRLIFVI